MIIFIFIIFIDFVSLLQANRINYKEISSLRKLNQKKETRRLNNITEWDYIIFLFC